VFALGKEDMKRKLVDTTLSAIWVAMTVMFWGAALLFDEVILQMYLYGYITITGIVFYFLFMPSKIRAWVRFWCVICATIPIVAFLHGVTGVPKYVRLHMNYFKRKHR
jgi:hypothetical protein